MLAKAGIQSSLIESPLSWGTIRGSGFPLSRE